jgi:DNA replication protein DnaC
MTEAILTLKQSLSHLHLKAAAGIVEDLLLTAEKLQWSYRECIQQLLDHEGNLRKEKQLDKRYKSAALPERKTLAAFNTEQSTSVSKKQLAQLQELVWLEQAYHILLLGPPGVGRRTWQRSKYRGFRERFQGQLCDDGHPDSIV